MWTFTLCIACIQMNCIFQLFWKNKTERINTTNQPTKFADKMF